MANPGPDGISLREAILATNSTPGPHTIGFSPSLAGKTIVLGAELPRLTRHFTSIVGLVNETADPLVTIDSQALSTGFATLEVQASYLTIRGLRFTGSHAMGPTLAIAVLPADIRHIRIVENVFHRDEGDPGVDGGIVVGSGPAESPGDLADVVIARNRFEMAGMNVQGVGGTTISDVVIDQNTFSHYVDGVEIVESGRNSLIRDTRITRNDFADGVLPLYMGIASWAGVTSGNVIEDTLVSRNSFARSNEWIAALVISGGDDTVAGQGFGTADNVTRNTRFVNNLVRDGPIVGVSGGANGATNNRVETVEILNNTFSSFRNGAAVQVESNGPGGTGNSVTGVSVRNTIFQAGPSADNFQGEVTPSQVQFSLTCQSGFAGVNGNVCADPLFVDSAAGDFHLQAGSPAIDAATSNGTPTTDLECRTRFDDPTTANTGTGPSPFFDMGAFEFGSTAATCASLDTDAPAPVSGLSAAPQGHSISLTWTNPPDSDLAAVVVQMAETDARPATPEQGVRIYEGTGAATNAPGLTPCATYSFSIFPRDTSGNYGIPTSIVQPLCHALTVSRTGTGRGAVRSGPTGIDCGPTCSALFETGETVTLTAAAEAGSAFVGWGGDCTGGGDCTITIDAPRAASAEFTPLPSSPSPPPLPPPPPPPPFLPPVGPDMTGPTLALAARPVQRLGRRGEIVVRAGCPTEACLVTARGSVSVTGSSRTFRLRAASARLARRANVTLRLKLSRRDLAAVRRALKRHRRVVARLALSATDSAGNRSTARRSVRLRP